jgi:hypothetical protein
MHYRSVEEVDTKHRFDGDGVMRTNEEWDLIREAFRRKREGTPRKPKALDPRLLSVPEGTVSAAEIDAKKTPPDGFKRATLEAWGVPWPPPKGWRSRLTAR